MSNDPGATRLLNAPRCLARTRRGTECQSPAVKGKRRCRMHGGNNPGAPKGNQNAWKHGRLVTQAKRMLAISTGVKACDVPIELAQAKALQLRIKRQLKRCPTPIQKD